MQSVSRISRCCQVNYCRRLVSKYLSVLPQCSAPVSHVKYCQHYSTAADIIPPPDAVGEPKQYPPKIHKLVDDISQLSLLEVADLNELLKKTLNIQDAPMMAMGAMPAAAAQAEDEDDAAPVREKTTFTVKLTQFDAGKKIQVIKEIKNIVEGLNLVQAKKFVESVPQVVQADISKEEAEKLKESLAAVGAEVSIE